jgi:hypothetical protein
MATLSVATHATKQIIRLTLGFTTSDTGSVIRAYRTTPSGSKTRLRLSRGVIVGNASYGGLVIGTDLPVAGFTPTGFVYSGITVLDPEPPQGVVCGYSFVVIDSTGSVVDSSSIVNAPTACDMGGDFFYDLSKFGRGVTTNVLEFNQLSTSIKTDVNVVLAGGGPTASVDLVGLPSFRLRLGTFSDTEAAAMRGLLRLGGPIYALSPESLSYGFEGPVYFAITGFNESRAVNLGAEVTRLWEIDCQQVNAPGAYYGTLTNAAVIANGWATTYLGYAVEAYGVVNGGAGHAVAYPVGSVV